MFGVLPRAAVQDVEMDQSNASRRAGAGHVRGGFAVGGRRLEEAPGLLGERRAHLRVRSLHRLLREVDLFLPGVLLAVGVGLRHLGVGVQRAPLQPIDLIVVTARDNACESAQARSAAYHARAVG